MLVPGWLRLIEALAMYLVLFFVRCHCFESIYIYTYTFYYVYRVKSIWLDGLTSVNHGSECYWVMLRLQSTSVKYWNIMFICHHDCTTKALK